jgi:uncharacterized membrane protein
LNSWVRNLSWLFFAATMYLIFQEAVLPYFRLPSLGNIGFTLVFVGFALLHCTATEGPRRTALFFSISAIVSYLLEELGVRSGIIYGPYHYSDLLGPKLGHVPIIIPLAWFMMIYPSWTVARALLKSISLPFIAGLTLQAVVAALIMTAWDVVMDPGMAAAGNWIWEKGGAYFGVPRHNYLGWLLTTFLVYWIAGWLWRNQPHTLYPPSLFAALPVIVYSFLALRYVAANRFPALQLVALFAMGTPSLLALTQVFLKPSSSAHAPSAVGARIQTVNQVLN